MMTVKQAAERMGVSESLVYEFCSDGALAHYRIGRTGHRGKILIDLADIIAFLATQKVGGKALCARQHNKVFKHVVIPK